MAIILCKQKICLKCYEGNYTLFSELRLQRADTYTESSAGCLGYWSQMYGKHQNSVQKSPMFIIIEYHLFTKYCATER